MTGAELSAAERNRLEATTAPISEIASDCRLWMESDIWYLPLVGSGTIPQPCQGYCIGRAKWRKRQKSAIFAVQLSERQIYAAQKTANFTNTWCPFADICGFARSIEQGVGRDGEKFWQLVGEDEVHEQSACLVDMRLGGERG